MNFLTFDIQFVEIQFDFNFRLRSRNFYKIIPWLAMCNEVKEMKN